jgi:hypothetical protein
MQVMKPRKRAAFENKAHTMVGPELLADDLPDLVPTRELALGVRP